LRKKNLARAPATFILHPIPYGVADSSEAAPRLVDDDNHFESATSRLADVALMIRPHDAPVQCPRPFVSLDRAAECFSELLNGQLLVTQRDRHKCLPPAAADLLVVGSMMVTAA